MPTAGSPQADGRLANGTAASQDMPARRMRNPSDIYALSRILLANPEEPGPQIADAERSHASRLAAGERFAELTQQMRSHLDRQLRPPQRAPPHVPRLRISSMRQDGTTPQGQGDDSRSSEHATASQHPAADDSSSSEHSAARHAVGDSRHAEHTAAALSAPTQSEPSAAEQGARRPAPPPRRTGASRHSTAHRTCSSSSAALLGHFATDAMRSDFSANTARTDDLLHSNAVVYGEQLPRSMMQAFELGNMLTSSLLYGSPPPRTRVLTLSMNSHGSPPSDWSCIACSRGTRNPAFIKPHHWTVYFRDAHTLRTSGIDPSAGSSSSRQTVTSTSARTSTTRVVTRHAAVPVAASASRLTLPEEIDAPLIGLGDPPTRIAKALMTETREEPLSELLITAIFVGDSYVYACQSAGICVYAFQRTSYLIDV